MNTYIVFFTDSTQLHIKADVLSYSPGFIYLQSRDAGGEPGGEPSGYIAIFAADEVAGVVRADAITPS